MMDWALSTDNILNICCFLSLLIDTILSLAALNFTDIMLCDILRFLLYSIPYNHLLQKDVLQHSSSSSDILLEKDSKEIWSKGNWIWQEISFLENHKENNVLYVGSFMLHMCSANIISKSIEFISSVFSNMRWTIRVPSLLSPLTETETEKKQKIQK